MTTATAVEPAADLMTFNDFCVLVADGQKGDLIDGVIYVASPDSRRPNSITRFLTSLIDTFVAAKALGGEVYVNRFAYKLSEYDAPEPDVGYVSPSRLALVQEGRMEGAPDVAIEVVSPSSRERDYVTKRGLYEKHGVGEYWIIDPAQGRAEFLRLNESGRFGIVRLDDNRIFRSRQIPGFWLNVEWLMADPLPNVFDCLQQLLKE